MLDIVPGGGYAMYGPSTACGADGKGGLVQTSNNVYLIKNSTSLSFNWATLPYSSLGCFLAGNPNTLGANEYTSSILDGSYQNRTDAINKCYQVAQSRGHNLFALQTGGQCFSSFDVFPGGDYMKFGVSSFCPYDGKGMIIFLVFLKSPN